MSSILALIPARSGSQRLPGKNIIDVCGKPMIEWTLIAAHEAKIFDQVLVTTNDVRVREIVRPYCSVIVEQPNFPQTPDVMRDVVMHAIRHQRQTYIMLLQPTSPLRTAQHIVEAWKLFQKSFPTDSLVSVDPAGNVNGAIYLFTIGRMMRGSPIYDDGSLRYSMAQDVSVDVDTHEDVERARALLGAKA